MEGCIYDCILLIDEWMEESVKVEEKINDILIFAEEDGEEEKEEEYLLDLSEFKYLDNLAVDEIKGVEKNKSIEIEVGESLTDRGSVFQAFLGKLERIEDVEVFLSQLLSIKKVSKATHNIMAYRFRDPKGMQYHDFDDDGESGAGKKLADLLRILDAGNIIVVVSRWYGGTLLGPDRFRHINNCARKIIEKVASLKK